MNDIYWKLIVAFLAGLLVGIGSTWLWFDNQRAGTADEMEKVEDGMEKDTTDDTSRENGSEEPVSTTDNWVMVEDQFPGNSVLLQAVSFSDGGWVAVYEDNNGEPGNILGARRFDAGEHSGEVSLLRSTKEGSLYYVILHRDDGDSEFKLEEDTQLLDEKGNHIETQFQTPPHRN